MRILILIVGLLLAACATRNAGFSAEEGRLRRNITRFALEGMVKYQSKVTVARNNAFTLVQTEPGHYELRLFDGEDEQGNLIEFSRLTVTDGLAQRKTRLTELEEAATPQELMRQVFNTDLPLYCLPEWVLGLTGQVCDGFLSTYNKQHLEYVALRDSVAGGYWSVKLDRYQLMDTGEGHVSMPRRIRIKHEDSPIGEQFEFTVY